MINESNRFQQQRQGSTRRLIKFDYSAFQNDDDEDADEEYFDSRKKTNISPGAKIARQNVMYRTAYDLATRCPSRKSVRRHTTVCNFPIPVNMNSEFSSSTHQSSPRSYNSNSLRGEDTLGLTLPEISWSRSSLQEELFDSKQWADECLSLTLEEIVHIRSVLTKAELESLPVDGQVKYDVEKRKVCFLCLKTRFSLFGSWGQICKLCKRTVCGKCSSKMRIPTEHFSHVPVLALSPTMISPVEQDTSFASTIISRLNDVDHEKQNVGTGISSAPNSPNMYRNPMSQLSPAKTSDPDRVTSGPQSIHNIVNIGLSSPQAKNKDETNKFGPRNSKVERLKGIEMVVCMDCKTMVLQIIKSSRGNRNNILHALAIDFTMGR